MSNRANARSLAGGLRRVDVHLIALHGNRVGAHGYHARRRGDRARRYVESPVVKIALHDIPVDISLGERPGSVCAGVVGDVDFPVYIEYSEDKIRFLDL